MSMKGFGISYRGGKGVTKLGTWLAAGILLVLFIFTSGLVFKFNTNKVIGSLDTPYSFALSHERTGMVGVFTKDDIECAEWLARKSNQTLPIISDINGCILLKSLIEDESRIEIRNLGRVTLGNTNLVDECYIFVTSWNARHQRYVESEELGAGLRAIHDLPTFNYPVAYRVGEAVVYLKGKRE